MVEREGLLKNAKQHVFGQNVMCNVGDLHIYIDNESFEGKRWIWGEMDTYGLDWNQKD